MIPRALIVAGPTASGKSAIAMALAERLHGIIINADAMQVYRELRIITARPSLEDEIRVPHALYGVRSASEPGSVAWWRSAALAEMTRVRADGRLPILTGGTGLYFASLTAGLAHIPEPGPDARGEARRLLKEIGPTALYARLAKADPDTAARLRPTDSQRIARAWEVWCGTGRGLAAWQEDPGRPAAWHFAAILLDPPRSSLRAAITVRLAAMVHAGAVDEIRALMALDLDPALPAMRALGVLELATYIQGKLTLEQAIRQIELATAQYSKRQTTWFRHHTLAESSSLYTIHALIATGEQFSERNHPRFWEFIKRMG